MVFSRRRVSVARSCTFFDGLRDADFFAGAFFAVFLTTFFVAFFVAFFVTLRAATGRTLANYPSVA
jgi:hypothetical protein